MAITIGDKAARELALGALDRSDGLELRYYKILSVLLTESNNADVLDQVDIANDLAFIGEDYVETELAKLKETA